MVALTPSGALNGRLIRKLGELGMGCGEDGWGDALLSENANGANTDWRWEG